LTFLKKVFSLPSFLFALQKESVNPPAFYFRAEGEKEKEAKISSKILKNLNIFSKQNNKTQVYILKNQKLKISKIKKKFELHGPLTPKKII